MIECPVCIQLKDQETQRLGASKRKIYNLVELPVKTERKELVVLCCPMCDGDIVKTLKERNV